MRRLSQAELREFLEHSGTKSVGPHKMTKHTLHWRYCARCGLVALKNKATRKALKQPCVVYE